MGLLSPQWSAKQMAQLSRSLAMMNASDITLVRSLELIAEEPASRGVGHILLPIADRLRRGEVPAQAFRSQGRRFPEFFLEMVAIGDRIGTLDRVFKDLATAYEEEARLIAEYIRGLAYPLTVLFCAVYLIPVFSGFFLTNQPVEVYLLHAVIGIAWQIMPPLVLLIILGQIGVLRPLSMAVGTHFWVSRSILYDMALARFFRALALMLDAGLNVTLSIERAAAATVHPRLRKKLVTAVPLVQQGATLYEALQSTGVLPEMPLEMVWTGEHAGALDELLDKTARYLHEGAMFRHQISATSFLALAIPIGVAFYLLRGMVLQIWMVFRAMLAW
jgi:type IV pilus assembly protein PilC